MKTRFKMLTWNIKEQCIFSRNFKNKNEAKTMAKALSNRRLYPHSLLKIFQVEKTGHRWELAVWRPENPLNVEYVSFYSKKDAIFANRVIEKFDMSIETELTKIY